MCYVPRFANWRSWRDSAQSVGNCWLAEANTTFGICLANISPRVHFEAHMFDYNMLLEGRVHRPLCMMSGVSGARLSSRPTFTCDDGMCAVLDAFGCGNPFLRQLTLSLFPRCIDVLTFSSDLSLSSVRHPSQRMRARRFEWRTVLAV